MPEQGETLWIWLGLFLLEVCFILKWSPQFWRAVPPSWMLLMALLSPKEAVMLGRPICFNITQPPCICMQMGMMSFLSGRSAVLPQQLLLRTHDHLVRQGGTWLHQVLKTRGYGLPLQTLEDHSVVFEFEVGFLLIQNSGVYESKLKLLFKTQVNGFSFCLWLPQWLILWPGDVMLLFSFLKIHQASEEQMEDLSLCLPSWMTLRSQNCQSTFGKAFL